LGKETVMRTTPKTLKFVSLLLAASALASVAQAQVYKTVDANGQVHFTDRAPSDATQVRTPTPPKTPAAPAAPRPAATAPAASPGEAPPLPVSNTQSQQVQRDVAAAREEQCKTARENYDKSVRAQRIYRVNDKGEREFLDGAAADAARLQHKAEMDSVCGS
jgi:hypothetical protein